MVQAIDNDNYFDVAEAIYAYCSMHHSGQSSELYKILCQSEFKPGPMWSESRCKILERKGIIMNSKHTPGPWYIHDSLTNDDLIINGGGDGDGNTDLTSIHTGPNQHANASLIAAAPDMLAELMLIQAELLEHENADAELASRLYRVIAKAKGE